MMLETRIGHFCLQSITLYVLFWLPHLSSCKETHSSVSSLTDSNTISSPQHSFRLGFISPPNNTNRYLAIYFSLSPDTIIWIANRERPLNDSSGHLALAPDGNLVLSNRWNETIWSTNISATSVQTKTSAQLMDTGNLLLKDISTGSILWESFSQPLNVLVPTMKMSYDTNTRTKVSLTSWKSMSDPAIGNFTGGIEAMPIPQSIHRQNGRPFWRSGPWNGHIWSGIEIMHSPFLQGPRARGGPPVDPQGLGLPQLYKENAIYNFVNPKGLFFSKAVLNLTGHLIVSLWNDRQRDWQLLSVNPQHECDRYGTCGPYSSCNRMDSPICSCLTGFEPSDPEEWNMGKWASGCVRRRPLQCSLSDDQSGVEDRFFKLANTKVPDFAGQVALIQSTECREWCLGNCSCIAYAYDPYIGCMVWHDSLIDIMVMDGVGMDLYIRLQASELDNTLDMRLVITISVIGGISFTCIIILIVAWRMVKRQGRKCKDKDKDKEHTFTTSPTTIVLKDETENVNIEELPLFTFKTLANATNQFDDNNLLGAGGFGQVYKGILQNGKEIAVKRLSVASRQGKEEFMNEVLVISKLQHRNLVILLGCCVERDEKILVYEHMPNKSLDRCLFDITHVPRMIIDWERRSSIIGGIARGLLYLHNDSRLKIIHRDLKPSNVLLDEDWNPKISDFGMARIFGTNEEHDNTNRVVGTYGYMAPEYAMEGQYSEKSDIYSFGVLMLEILSGKKSTHYHNQVPSSIIGYAWKMWYENNGLEFADQTITSLSVNEDILRCINIALLCVQEVPNDRPSIETILSMLSNEIIDLQVPKEPDFLQSSLDATTQTLSQLGHSINELTITVIEGR